MNEKCFLICLGATGGHIFPGVAVASEIKNKLPKSKIVFVNTKNSNENMKKINFDYQIELINSRGFVGKNIFDKIKSILLLFNSIFQTLKIINKVQPDYIIGSGGFAWLPVAIAGFLSGKNLFTIEGNSIPGLANRISSYISKKIYIGFEESKKFFPKRKTVLTGYPIRKNKYKTSTKNIDILIMGGSQGSNLLNIKFATQLEDLLLKLIQKKIGRINIVHQTGINDYNKIKKTYEKLSKKYKIIDYKVEPFIDDIFYYLSKSKILISRAGASTIFESFLFDIHPILVPLSSSTNNHQYKNAIETTNKRLSDIWLEKEELYKLTDKIVTQLITPKNNIEITSARLKIKNRDSSKLIIEDMINGSKN